MPICLSVNILDVEPRTTGAGHVDGEFKGAVSPVDVGIARRPNVYTAIAAAVVPGGISAGISSAAQSYSPSMT